MLLNWFFNSEIHMKYAIVQGYNETGDKRYSAAFFDESVRVSEIKKRYKAGDGLEIICIGRFDGTCNGRDATTSTHPSIKIVVDEVQRANQFRQFDRSSLDRRLTTLK